MKKNCPARQASLAPPAFVGRFRIVCPGARPACDARHSGTRVKRAGPEVRGQTIGFHCCPWIPGSRP